MNGSVTKTMSETIEVRNPAHVDLSVIFEGEWVALEARTTHEVEIDE
jgi:hypothetical protein